MPEKLKPHALLGLMILFLLGVIWLSWPIDKFKTKTLIPPATKRFIELSKDGASLSEYPFPKDNFAETDLIAAETYVLHNPDFTSYHLLFILKQESPEIFNAIPNNTKAKVLCSALSSLNYFNDWGVIGPRDSLDTEVAQLLISTGRTALPYLQNILNDKRPARHAGSNEATISKKYEYRRADYAYRYIMLICGRNPTFSLDTSERDRLIDLLNTELNNNER